MLRKALKVVSWIGAGIIVLAVVVFLAAMNIEVVQDRLVTNAVQRGVLAGLDDDWGGDKLEVAFCGTASPMGNGPSAQQCIGVLAGDKFFKTR